MAINEKLTNRIRELLADVDKAEEKKMFSGIAFMIDDKLCIALRGDNIMLRIDPVMHDELIEKDGCSNMIMRGKSLEGYIVVGETALDSTKALSYWIKLALDFNPKAQPSKKKKLKK